MVTVAVLAGLAAYSGYNANVKAASTALAAQAKRQSAEVHAEMDAALNSAIALANVLSAVKSPGNVQPLSREQVTGMLRQVASRMPNVLAVYTAWEPNSFDGKDSDYAGKPGYDATGRLLPYLARNSLGEVTLEPLTDLENQERGPTGVRKGEYYLCSKETLVPCVLDPYPYPIEGKEVLMTSLIAPIVLDGRFFGIAGIDIQLGTLQRQVDRANDGAEQRQVAILSTNGRIVAARNRPSLAGKTGIEYRSWLGESTLNSVLQTSDYVARQGDELVAITRMQLDGTRKPWAVAVLVPYRSVTAAARATALRQAATGILVGLIVVALTVFIVVRGIHSILLRAVGQLSRNAGQVSNFSAQVAAASQVLAQGASEQAATIEETSASATQIHSMAAKNADTARGASSLTEQSLIRIGDANERLTRLIAAMAGIQESSNQISKINRTIDEIAFQTNILALNAAVEAARAGEAGMGFAVVAGEVRALAQRSAEAARETSGLIEKSIASYQEGRAKVDQVAEAIQAITRESAAVRELVEGVTRGSEEQARAVEQVSQAIVQMEQVTQRTAAAAEQCASASQEMTAQVYEVNHTLESLESLVGSKGHLA